MYRIFSKAKLCLAFLMSKNRVWHSSFVLLWVVRLRRHGTDFTKAKLVVCLLFRTPMPSFCSLSAVALKLALLRIAPGEIKDFHVAIVVLNRQSSSLCRLSHRLTPFRLWVFRKTHLRSRCRSFAQLSYGGYQ